MTLKRWIILLVSAFVVTLYFTCSQANAETVRVVKVIDGDTVWVSRNDGTSIKVRLQYIDAPESCQEYGKLAMTALSTFALNKDADLKITGASYDRYVGSLDIQGDVGAKMVQSGNAWVYRKSTPKKNSLRALEDIARHDKVGLWGASNPIEPWVFRKTHKCTYK